MKQLKIKERTYDIENPTQFFLDLFSFRKENNSYFPTDHWELVLGAVIGNMGSGKTTLLNFIAALGKKIYDDEFTCFHTDDIVFTLNYLNAHPELRKKVLFLFLDDALTKPGSDSRRAMSEDNVKASQNLSIIRHLLAQEDENGLANPLYKAGFCAIFYAVQDPGRLDPFIRRNLHITLFKTYYDSLDKILDVENLQFIRDITENSMYRHNYSSRGYALGITKTGGIMRMFFPMTDYNIPILYSEEQSHEDIINHVLKLNLDEVKDVIIKGYIREFCFQNKIKLDSKELSEIVEIARYQHWKSKMNNENIQEDQTKRKCADVHRYLVLGKTLRYITEKVNCTKGWIEYNYPKWCKEVGITPIKIKQIRKKLKELEKKIPTNEDDNEDELE